MTENNKPTEKDLQDAAQCWCDTRVSGREMDAFLATVFAEKLAATRLETLKMKEIKELADAARGLRFGEDWNNGTHAKLHGYREKLIEASENFDALIKKLEGK